MRPTRAFNRFCCQKFCHLESWIHAKCVEKFDNFDENFITDLMEVLLYTMVNRNATYEDITNDLFDGAMIPREDVMTALYALIQIGFIRANPIRYDGPYDPSYAPRYKNTIYVEDISEMEEYGKAAIFYCEKMRKPIISKKLSEL